MLQICKENFCLYNKIPVEIDQTVRIRTAGYPAVLLHFPCYYKQPIYAGNAIATVQSSDPIKVLTVRGTSFDEAAASVDRKSVV